MYQVQERGKKKSSFFFPSLNAVASSHRILLRFAIFRLWISTAAESRQELNWVHWIHQIFPFSIFQSFFWVFSELPLLYIKSVSELLVLTPNAQLPVDMDYTEIHSLASSFGPQQ